MHCLDHSLSPVNMGAFQCSFSFRFVVLIMYFWLKIIVILSHQECFGLVAASAKRTAGNETDRLALLAIKAQIVGDPLRVTSSWNDSLHFCQWQGVSCSHKHQRVTQLNLSSKSLTGYLSPFIGNLSFLRVIDLSDNSLKGDKVLLRIGNLFRLQKLFLPNNSFQGQIPSTLSNCSKLTSLDLVGNNFTGKIPFQLGFLSELRELFIASNSLEGSIPPHLGNLSSLQVIYLRHNKLVGEIPQSLGQLKSLTFLDIGDNMLSGIIPSAIYNISSLEVLRFPYNQIHGTLPHNIGLTLPKIRSLLVWGNQLSGPIPVSLSNASNLMEISISRNKFFGGVPNIFGNLNKLIYLMISQTDLGSGPEAAHDLNFITSLTNCSNLKVLSLGDNNFGGKLPNSIGHLSTQLEFLEAQENQISGNIPSSIGNLISLSTLDMHSNELTGAIPTSIGKLSKLQILDLNQNELSGEIPSSVGNLTFLAKLWLNRNNLHGSIPSTLGNCQKLLLLDLSENSLSGTIPPNLIGLSSLSIYLNLSKNHLNGSLPWEVGNLKSLASLNVSHNILSGNIPRSLGECASLRWLNMEHNIFKGAIPESLNSLKAIEVMDLSSNNLSGPIPKDFAKLVLLSKLNLSFNNLEGEIPTGGVFSNVTKISVVGNNKLCGGIPELHLAACLNKELKKRNLSRVSKVIISIACSLLGVCLMCVLIIFLLKKDRKRPSETSQRDPFINVSYGELLKATNGFSQDNLIGVGSFGSVYKGVLEPHQTQVAVKVFNLEKRGASKSFMAECETLRNIRHRNLVKIITACSSVDYQGNDFKALVYELMPNGSLETWLHPLPQTSNEEKKGLTLSQRLNMVIDVAYAIDYLHSHTESPIVHCDLKPSNILLDQDMTAHVGDFGLSRIISADQISENNTSSVGIKGTIGYAAPEYGMGSKVSTEGDIYSFGILLLEIFTGKRPTDGEFRDGENLNLFVKMALPEKVVEIIDPGLIPEREEEEASSSNRSVQQKWGKVHECLISILGIGVMCSTESPKERLKINNVLKELVALKNKFLEDGRSNNRARNFQLA